MIEPDKTKSSLSASRKAAVVLLGALAALMWLILPFGIGLNSICESGCPDEGYLVLFWGGTALWVSLATYFFSKRADRNGLLMLGAAVLTFALSTTVY